MASIKLVAIAKDEAAYLAEWIYHHLSIGIDEIDIYLNGITDNSYRLMRLIGSKFTNVNFYNADSLMATSVRAKSSFQQIIYRFAWSTERRKKRFSHLAFLDIDEYLVSAEFGQTISSLLRSAGEFDVLSNLWYSDLPSKAEPFSRFFCESQMVQKMAILKSIGRLRSKIGMPVVHNFSGIKRYPAKIKACISSGLPIQYSGLGKRVGRDYRLQSIGQMEPWFIYHRIFRSHDEYCASLMRGRKHRSNDAPIKDNRSGFIAFKESNRTIGDPIEFKIKSRRSSRYQRGFDEFVNQCDVGDEIVKGQADVRERYKELERLVNAQPDILQRFSNVFRGTVFEG